MFDFPNSPTNGQVFAPSGGPIYVYTGGVWRMQGSGQVVTAETRNRIVNGAFQISQENGNSLLVPTNVWTVDQWFFVNSGPAFTSQRVQVVTPNGSANRLRLTVTTAKGTLAANDYFTMITWLEGIRVADFRFGSAAAKQVVLRFGIKAPAGTYSVKFANSAQVRSYVGVFTISADQANADTEQVIVIPGDVTGTWLTDNSSSVRLEFDFGSGSNFNGVAGWQAGNFTRTAACSNGWATAGNVFELFDVGLYLDPNNTGKAPPWQMPDEAQELIACMRYWQSTTCHLDGNVTTGLGYNAAGLVAVIPRVVPALTGVNMTIQAFPATLSLSYASPNMVYDTHTCNLTARGIIRTIVYASARM